MTMYKIFSKTHIQTCCKYNASFDLGACFFEFHFQGLEFIYRNTVFPIDLDASVSYLSNSSNLLIHLIMDPSKVSVILQISANDPPLAQQKVISTS